MSGFLYAIPKVSTIGAKQLAKVGLAPVFDKVKESQRPAGRGPGGGQCTLVCIGGNGKSLFYKPAEQTWQKSHNGKYWVGFYNDDPPTEQGLRRKTQLAGHYVELTDGGKWLVPVARILSGGSRLPQSLILGSNGEVITEPLPQYAGFSSKVEKAWEDFQVENGWKEGELQLSIAERMKLAIEALGWNYHVQTEEVNLLKLITTQNLNGEILAAIIDLPTLVEISKEFKEHKKKDESADIDDGTSSKDGSADS